MSTSSASATAVVGRRRRFERAHAVSRDHLVLGQELMCSTIVRAAASFNVWPCRSATMYNAAICAVPKST